MKAAATVLALAISTAVPSGSGVVQAGQPSGALEWFRQGVELARQGDYAAALVRFERARSLSPNWALPYLEIAVAHMMTDNDAGKISQALEAAVRLGGEIPRAHYLMGIHLQQQSRRKRAIAEFTRALQLRPSLLDARYRLALLYVESGLQQRGIEQLELVVRQNPSHLGARRTLALLYEQSGQPELAEQHLLAVCKLYPGRPVHLEKLARFYERVGWRTKARKARKRLERLEPVKKRYMRPLLPSPDVRRRYNGHAGRADTVSGS